MLVFKPRRKENMTTTYSMAHIVKLPPSKYKPPK